MNDLSEARLRALVLAPRYAQAFSTLRDRRMAQLARHLQEYGMTSNVFDSRAYVDRSRIQPADPLTWTDVVVEQGKYFHPVGGGDRSGWPVIPPSYIGFRYLSEFRSVHFIERVDVTDHL